MKSLFRTTSKSSFFRSHERADKQTEKQKQAILAAFDAETFDELEELHKRKTIRVVVTQTLPREETHQDLEKLINQARGLIDFSKGGFFLDVAVDELDQINPSQQRAALKMTYETENKCVLTAMNLVKTVEKHVDPKPCTSAMYVEWLAELVRSSKELLKSCAAKELNYPFLLENLDSFVQCVVSGCVFIQDESIRKKLLSQQTKKVICKTVELKGYPKDIEMIDQIRFSLKDLLSTVKYAIPVQEAPDECLEPPEEIQRIRQSIDDCKDIIQSPITLEKTYEPRDCEKLASLIASAGKEFIKIIENEEIDNERYIHCIRILIKGARKLIEILHNTNKSNDIVLVCSSFLDAAKEYICSPKDTSFGDRLHSRFLAFITTVSLFLKAIVFCDICSKLIEEQYVRSGKKKYCSSCFCCSKCGKTLGDEYYVLQHEYYCFDDYRHHLLEVASKRNSYKLFSSSG